MLYNVIYLFHMPLFFFISGFCFSYYHDYKKFIHKKISRLLLPYICFGLLDAIPRLLLSQFVNRPTNFEALVMKLIFSGGEYWFLYVLFCIFLFYPLISNIYEYGRKYIVIASIVIFIISSTTIDIYIFRMESILYYLVYFNAGYLSKIFFGKLQKINIKRENVISIIISGFVFLVVAGYLKIHYGFGKIEIIIVAFVGIFFSWLLTRTNHFNILFASYGRYSLQLYLLNGFTLGISRTVICNFMQVNNPYIIIFSNMLLDFFIAYWFIKYICTKFKLLRIVMGI